MILRRHAPSALFLLAVCALATGTSPAEEPEPAPQPEATPTPAPAPAPAAAAPAAVSPATDGVPCSTWSHAGQPVEHISKLMDREKMQALGGAMGLTVKCLPTDGPAYRELHCTLSSQEWDFMVEVFDFDDPEDAQWEHERSFPGSTTRIDGSWLLKVHADNGPCSVTLLDTLVPSGSAVADFDPEKLAATFGPLGWTSKHSECDVEQDQGRHPFYSRHCRLTHGERWEASTSVTQRPGENLGAEETRRLDRGTAVLEQAEGSAEVTVFDGVSAEAMMRALLAD